MPREARGQGLTWSLPALYVLSGAAALILEVTWSRLLSLQFGHTTGATSTVLAAFMGGLAAGAAIGGRLAERWDRDLQPPHPNLLPQGEGLDPDRKAPGPLDEVLEGLGHAVASRKRALRLYAMLEVVVAISALILPIVLAAADPLLAWTYADGAEGWRFGVVRVVVSLVALAVPTMAMGATYPLAMQALTVDPFQAGRAAGRLYAANTLGAAAGALAAGFVLLPAVGIRMTTLAAVALNLAAAGIAWWLAARMPDPGLGSGLAIVRTESKLIRLPPISRYPWVGIVSAAIFGFVALANQVVWTRVIALVVGPTTYAFSAMVGVFIAGLATGAAMGTRLARGPRAASWLAVMAMGAGVAIALSIHFAGRLLLWNALAAASAPHDVSATAAGAGAFGAIVWRQIAVAAVLLGPLSIASGAAFPLAVVVASSGGTMLTPLRLSSVYAANTAGAIAGALLAGFVLVPALGLQTTVRMTALLSVLVGTLILVLLGVAARAYPAAPARSRAKSRDAKVSHAEALHAETSHAETPHAQTPRAKAPRVKALPETAPHAKGPRAKASRANVPRENAPRMSGSRVAASRLTAWRAWIRVGVALASGAVVTAGVFTLGSWDPALLSSGAYRYAPALVTNGSVDAADLEAVLTAGDLLFYDEGAAGTVAVRRLGGTTSLVIDGKPDASNDADMLTQKLLAHLPLLHHDAPRRALVLGLGSGVTAGAALTHPITALDVVEISPGVVSASTYFRSENRNALADPRTRLLVADGRSHLRLASSSYDVVISEPSNPWMAGVASLFTREFMRSVRDRLAPGGVFCQWTHTYDMSRDDLRSIVGTFTSVFPHASLWLVGESDVLLIGSASSLKSDEEALWRRYINPPVRDDLRAVAVGGIDDLIGLRVADAAALRRYTMDAPVQTDDRMALEFSAPRSLADRAGARNAAELLALASAPPVENNSEAGRAWASRGRMLLKAEAFDLAYDALANAIQLGLRVDDKDSAAAFAQAAAGAERMDAAIALLRARPAGDIKARVALARILVARGDADGALAVIERTEPPHPNPLPMGEGLNLFREGPPFHPDARLQPDARLRPDDARPRQVDVRLLREQASIFADVADADRLAPIVVQLREREPASRDTQYFSAALAFMQGDLASALAQGQALVSAHPDEARAHNLMGAALATRGQRDDGDGARAAFARAIAADPRDAAAYVNAGSLDLAQGRPAEARRHFAIALTLDPSSESARQGLANARAGLARR